MPIGSIGSINGTYPSGSLGNFSDLSTLNKDDFVSDNQNDINPSDTPNNSVATAIITALGGLGAAGITAGTALANQHNQSNLDANNLNYAILRDAIYDERYKEELAYNRAFSEGQRDYAREFAEDERAYTRAFQENERDYNRALQERLFEREDTALERQAESLSKLGINPLGQNMQGLNAGQVVGNYSNTPTSAPGSFTPGESSQRGLDKAFHDIRSRNIDLDLATPILETVNAVNNVHTGGIQRDLIRQQANQLKLNNLVYAKKVGVKYDEDGNIDIPDYMYSDQDFNKVEYEDKKASSERNERENQYQKDYHVTDNTTHEVRLASDIADQIVTALESANSTLNNEQDPKGSKFYNKAFKGIKKAVTSSARALGNSFRGFGDFIKRNTYNKNQFEKNYRR